ncbi:SMI1/KNR4 family protein [Streptomyces sp. NPDC056601]|uniref:SMI1/KNR4 family protein n=1 Tax=Streptomyces sp. NPDC056601 TaxID=3345875 RepID=UPI0036CB5312
MTDDELFEAVRARVGAGRPTDEISDVMAPEPASLSAVEEVERVVGLPLPPLVRRLYLEVADGGIGPFRGIYALREESAASGMLTAYIEGLNAVLDPVDPPLLPAGVLFFCPLHEMSVVLLDVRHPEGQMWWWEEGDRHKLDLTFPQWLEAWLGGRLTEQLMESRKLKDESWVGDWATEDLPPTMLELPDWP